MADIWADWSTTAASNTPVGSDTPDDLHTQLQNIKAQIKLNAMDRSLSQSYAASAVGTDSYAITLTPTLTAYANGQIFVFKADVGNTGACTLAIDGLAATDIKQMMNGAVIALATGDIIADQKCVVVYDSDNSAFILLNPSRFNRIVQVVHYQTGAKTGTTAVTPIDDTIPQITEGAELFTLAITPTSATNKLLINVSLGIGGVAFNAAAALHQDTTVDALACKMKGINGFDEINFTHYMDAGTTSETTFRVRIGGDGSFITLNGYSDARYGGGVFYSGITITEIRV